MSDDQAEPATTEHRDVAEGRGHPGLPRASAQAIADASEAAGFPVPAQIQALLDAPEPEAVAGDASLTEEG